MSRPVPLSARINQLVIFVFWWMLTFAWSDGIASYHLFDLSNPGAVPYGAFVGVYTFVLLAWVLWIEWFERCENRRTARVAAFLVSAFFAARAYRRHEENERYDRPAPSPYPTQPTLPYGHGPRPFQDNLPPSQRDIPEWQRQQARAANGGWW